MVLALLLLVAVQFIESLRRYHRIFTPGVFYVLFALCIALIVADLLFTNHHHSR